MSDTPRQAEMLANRVRKSARHMRKWARREAITCYRIYDRDIPEVPVAVDWYDGRIYIAHRRRDGEGEDSSAWLSAMAEAVGSALEVSVDKVYVKTRRRQRGLDQYERVANTGSRFEVEEGGLRFWVNLADYLDTGLFLDHRQTRARVRDEANGARFLNLFCYTGSFTVYAAAGGAASTASVDMSNRYLGWTRDNMALNGYVGTEHQFHRADALAFLDSPPYENRHFDLAVLDPPTFSNSKKMRDVLDLQRDQVYLVNRTLALLRVGGVLYFSTNRRGFKLDDAPFEGTVEDVTAETIPPDFANRASHRCYRIVRS